jgi:molecular chaperone GrpE
MFGFFTKAENQEQRQKQWKNDVLSGVEKICSVEFSSVKDSLDSLEEALNSLVERLSDAQEEQQQVQRQERRRQMALETIIENQNKILEKPQPSPPLEALMALAENLALASLARPADREFSILYGKLIDLLACFGLSPMIDEGSPFDPERHEACAARCNRARPENSVLEIVRPGFFLNGKVLRYATVVVNRYDAKEKEKKEGESHSSLLAPALYRNREPEWEGTLYD